MGKHTLWRKTAKKLRRKRLRQKVAKERDEILKKEEERRENSPRYKEWLKEQETARLFEEEEQKRLHDEQERLWREREKESHRQWQELQRKLEHIREERRRQEERIQQEWEKEQKLLKEAKERKEREIKEKEEQEELFRQQIDEYVTNGGHIPEDLLGNLETNPGKDPCPFFSKVGVCRFGDACSRNHIRPKVGNILLLRGFYTHITLSQGAENEYGNDSSLEYEDTETLLNFYEFFDDILPEFQKCGCVVHLKVCCNKEPHLRGNVYVEYINPRDAIRAFRTFQGRWYGGKQLNVEFCNISSWRSAICGLSFRKRCPKGSSCNFLHVFRNPGRMFEDYSTPSIREERRNDHNDINESSRNWRWSSVTPEREIHYENNHNTRQRSPNYRMSQNYRSKERNYSSIWSRSRSPLDSKRRKRSRSRSLKERSERSKEKSDRSRTPKSNRSRHSKERRRRSPS